MTTIRFTPNELKLEVKEHAGDSMVCAGISALVGCLAAALMGSEAMLESKTINIDEGNCLIECKPLPEWKGYIQRSYWTVLKGMELITMKYPQSARLEIA